MSVRLAPSPTGRFHIGNLRTALVAQLWSEALQWPLVLRFEDIDRPRVVAGAQEQQLEDLTRLGITNFKVEVQSQNHQRHWSVFSVAQATDQVYPCFCSRKVLQQDLAGLASAPHEPLRQYSGKCRNLSEEQAAAIFKERAIEKLDLGWRFRGPDLTGSQDILVARSLGLSPQPSDFIPSYQWACSLDDFLDGHQLLIRAWDLETSILPQRMIQNWLAMTPQLLGRHGSLGTSGQGLGLPAVFHTALITLDNGARLEKRTQGVTLSELDPLGLRQKLEDSIDRKAISATNYQTGKVWGEVARTLKWPTLRP